MTIEVDESIRAIYYHHFSPMADLMVGISERTDGFHSQGRLHIYLEDSGDAFKDKDVKRWFRSAKPMASLEAALAKAKEMTETAMVAAFLIGGKTNEKPQILLRGGMTLEEFLDEFTKQPYVHTKRFDKDGKEELRDGDDQVS